MLALLLATAALQSIASTSSFAFGQQTPVDCLRTLPINNVADLVTCLDTFTVLEYDQSTYDKAQPTSSQRYDWRMVIESLLEFSDHCSSVFIPDSLQDFYVVEEFQDLCVLYEKTITTGGTYLKGWGTLIVPGPGSSVSRNVHFSVPRPGLESGTLEQASTLFKSTGSKSFLFPGRNHNALKKASDCISGAYQTDVTANTAEPFFDTNVAIHNWQLRNGGCPASSCAFIQIRGKGASTCASDSVFLSAGLGDSASSIAWYEDSTNRPAKALQSAFHRLLPTWQVTLPSDSGCSLTATKNVVGRYLNGVNISHVCGTAATSDTATGQFVQVEESSVARNAQFYGYWTEAVIDAFPGHLGMMFQM